MHRIRFAIKVTSHLHHWVLQRSGTLERNCAETHRPLYREDLKWACQWCLTECVAHCACKNGVTQCRSCHETETQAP